MFDKRTICFYLWTSIPAVNLFYFFHNKDKLMLVIDVAAFCLPSAAGMFLLPGPNNDILAVRMEQYYEIVEYPHSAIGHRLSATKVYKNNVPSLDWHGLKNFKDFEEFVNVSFFLSKQLNGTKSTGRIYKQILNKKNLLFIHSDSVSLKCSLHV